VLKYVLIAVGFISVKEMEKGEGGGGGELWLLDIQTTGAAGKRCRQYDCILSTGVARVCIQVLLGFVGSLRGLNEYELLTLAPMSCTTSR